MENIAVELCIMNGPLSVTIGQNYSGQVSRDGSGDVAGFDFGRMARIATCVVRCMAGVTAERADGADQPAHVDAHGEQLHDLKNPAGGQKQPQARPGR